MILATICTAMLGLQRQTVGENQGFVLSKLSATEIAKRADASMRKMEAAACETALTLVSPAGRGLNNGFAKIRDTKHILLRFGHINEGGSLQDSTVIRNGDRTALLMNSGWEVGNSSKTPWFSLPGKGIVANWPISGNKWVLSALVTDQNPITYLVSAAKASADYKTRCEERTVKAEGRTYHTFRIVITRTTSGEKKMGPYRAALTFEGVSYLPVTMAGEVGKGKNVTRTTWSARWSGPNTYPDKTFLLPR